MNLLMRVLLKRVHLQTGGFVLFPRLSSMVPTVQCRASVLVPIFLPVHSGVFENQPALVLVCFSPQLLTQCFQLWAQRCWEVKLLLVFILWNQLELVLHYYYCYWLNALAD